MATRPWITVEDLSSFTEHEEVKNKSAVKTIVMIALAESKIINYCKHDFSNAEKYPEIPADVKNATLILADALCYNDSLQLIGRLKGETFDDYSYTVETVEVSTDFDMLGISSLLAPYVINESGNTFLRLGVI
nr:MAG TPA: Head Tail Connector Protein [Caudoviricetes sp.]